MDYMPSDTLVILDEPNRIIESARQMEREEGEWQTVLLQQGELLPGLKISFSFDEVVENKDHQRIYLSLFMRKIRQSSRKM